MDIAEAKQILKMHYELLDGIDMGHHQVGNCMYNIEMLVYCGTADDAARFIQALEILFKEIVKNKI